MRKDRKSIPKSMMKSVNIKPDIHVYIKKTRKGRSYKFHPKHHLPEKGDHSCWAATINRDTEFGMFQEAETYEFSDSKGHLYNILKEGKDYVEIGTRSEIVARFCNPHSNSDWHGYPLWPIKIREQLNRKSEPYSPPSDTLQKMVDKQMMTERDRKRILRGDYP